MRRERAKVDILLARTRTGDDASWHERAECRNHFPDIWFPIAGDHRGQWAAAKAICATCPVATECLDYAIAADERWGCWGGMTPDERRRIKKERAA